MKITQEEVVDRQTVLHIELEEEDLGTYLDRGYKRVVQHAMIPGFRKGKAPRRIVETFLGRESLLQESLEFMLPDVTKRAVEAQELETTGLPKVELVDLEPVQVKATIALTPEIDLGAYLQIRVEEKAVEVSEEDVQQRLDQHRQAEGSWVPVERPVQIGDMVTLDVEGTVEDRSLLDEKDMVHVAQEGSVVPLPGFSEKLAGAVAGEPWQFSLAIPEDHPDATLAGKEASFSVTVSGVKERHLPELDDEFAKGVGDGYVSLAALREGVEGEIKAEAEDAQRTQYREAAIDALLEGATIQLPPLLADHEVEHMVSRRDRFVDSLDMSIDDYLRITGKTEDQTLEEMREHAVERLSRSYALSKLAELDGIEATEEDTEERIRKLAESSENPDEFMANPNLESEEVTDYLGNAILMEKAMDRLILIARGEHSEPSEEEPEAQSGDEDSQDGGEADEPQT